MPSNGTGICSVPFHADTIPTQIKLQIFTRPQNTPRLRHGIYTLVSRCQLRRRYTASRWRTICPSQISWQPCIDYSPSISLLFQSRRRLAGKFVLKQIVWQRLGKYAVPMISKTQHHTPEYWQANSFIFLGQIVRRRVLGSLNSVCVSGQLFTRFSLCLLTVRYMCSAICCTHLPCCIKITKFTRR